MHRRTTTALLVACLIGLVGCGAATPPAPTTAVTHGAADGAVIDGAVVIDVRTPAEFAAGHLEGALNLDASAPDFADRVAELDQAGSYVVYCRTGSRSAAAAALMTEQGFTAVTDAGGYEQAAADLGLPIVTG